MFMHPTSTYCWRGFFFFFLVDIEKSNSDVQTVITISIARPRKWIVFEKWALRGGAPQMEYRTVLSQEGGRQVIEVSNRKSELRATKLELHETKESIDAAEARLDKISLKLDGATRECGDLKVELGQTQAYTGKQHIQEGRWAIEASKQYKELSRQLRKSIDFKHHFQEEILALRNIILDAASDYDTPSEDRDSQALAINGANVIADMILNSKKGEKKKKGTDARMTWSFQPPRWSRVSVTSCLVHALHSVGNASKMQGEITNFYNVIKTHSFSTWERTYFSYSTKNCRKSVPLDYRTTWTSSKMPVLLDSIVDDH